MTELTYPYQIAVFLDKIPQVDEKVYEGPRGWLAQVALKRRFQLQPGYNEENLKRDFQQFCNRSLSFYITIDSLMRVPHMPVQVLGVAPDSGVMNFHADFLRTFGDHILSRYPEREGKNYFPHVTAEFDGKMVIDPDQFERRSFFINSVWLLKDMPDLNSWQGRCTRAIKRFEIKT